MFFVFVFPSIPIGVDGHTMAASDELRDKRAHKNKGVKVNDMTVAIGIASVFALFIFLAVSHTSQVGHHHTCPRFVLPCGSRSRTVTLHIQHSQHYQEPSWEEISLATNAEPHAFASCSHCCLCVWGSKRLPARRRCTAFYHSVSPSCSLCPFRKHLSARNERQVCRAD